MARKRLPPNDPREWLNRAQGNLARAQKPLPGAYLEDFCCYAANPDLKEGLMKAVRPYVAQEAVLMILMILIALPVGARSEILEVPWSGLTIDSTDLEIEYVSEAPPGKPEFKKKQRTTVYNTDGVNAFVLQGEFYADLSWLEKSPLEIDYGIRTMTKSDWQGRQGRAEKKKLDVRSKSVFDMKPLSPESPISSRVVISGKVECLWSVELMGGGCMVPLFFVEGTKATLNLKKGDHIRIKESKIVAKEDTEIVFTFDHQAKVTMKTAKGAITSSP